jgi:predicted DNA-binding transcriptional regulator AlpA
MSTVSPRPLTAADSATGFSIPKLSNPDISHFDTLPDSALINVNALSAVLAQGRSTIWRKCRAELDFPQPIRLSAGCTRFRVGDIRAYLAIRSAASAPPKRTHRLNGRVAI